jgi:hypothetical protein
MLKNNLMYEEAAKVLGYTKTDKTLHDIHINMG